MSRFENFSYTELLVINDALHAYHNDMGKTINSVRDSNPNIQMWKEQLQASIDMFDELNAYSKMY